MAYEMRLPGAVYGGAGSIEKAAEILAGTNNATVALFTDQGVKQAGLPDRLLPLLERAGATIALLDDLAAEPTVEQAEAAIARFRETRARFIVAMGGGSVMDIAKLASVLDTDDYTLRDLLSHPARATKQTPTLMIPTTAGTGAEATPNSIVTVTQQELKVGIVNPCMIADHVILDPDLIARLPRHIAAATGVDALAHAIECYTSKKATRFSDMYALEAMRLIFANIQRACDDQTAADAKEAMLTASYFAGTAIAAAGTTAVHALAYPLGGKYHIPHGVSNAMLLAPVMRFNRPACQDRLAAVCDVISPGGGYQSQEEKALHVIDRLEGIVRHLDIPTSLRAMGISPGDLEDLVEAGMKVTRLLQNNPREVTAPDARALYGELLR